MRNSNHIKSAVNTLSQHKQLSHDSLTTLDFGQIVPCVAMPLLPRDKFKINTSCFSRVAPMLFPTYGSCEIVTNFHSVQYSQIWRDFDIFVTGQKYRGTKSIYLPVVSSQVINTLFDNSKLSYVGSADANNHDLVVLGSSSGAVEYRFLTLFGRYVRKILSGLGYPFVNSINKSLTSTVHYYNALPLLSFFKIYHDYYESRQYSQNSIFAELLREAYSSITNGSYFSTGPVQYDTNTLTITTLIPFFEQLLLLFPSDYFTSAQNTAYLVGGSRPISVLADDSVYSPVFNDSYNEGYFQKSTGNEYYTKVFGTEGGNPLIHQGSYQHRILENLENLVRRFNLVGAREIDRIRSLFGVRPSVQRNQYSVWHGGFNSSLRIQDVTSTSAEPSVDNYLGSYAGKGIASDGSSISIESDDYGFLIGLSFIKVRPLYSPGLDREVLKLNPFSFYNPEFDHGYSMAVAVGEVQSNLVQSVNDDIRFNVFGYQNIYDEYRQRVSRVNGDFLDSDLLPFSFVRDNVGDGTGVVAQSTNLIYQSSPSSLAPSDGGNEYGMYNEFQRVFVDGSGRDHFYLYYAFDISALRPVRTSSSSFDLGVGDISTSNNPVI